MKYYLLKMKVFGIKNIDKEIELRFYDKVLTKKFNPTKYNVKAIYGANGAGKTALIYAAEIYKKFVLNKDYLALYNSNSSLENLINQILKNLHIEMTFVVLSDEYNVINIYSHAIGFAYRNDRYEVQSDVLKELHGLRLNDETKWKIVYEIQNGKLISSKNADIAEISKNVIFDRSVVSNIIWNIANNSIDKSAHSDILNVCGFAQSLTVLLYNGDKNYIDFKYIAKQIETISKYQKQMDENTFFQLLMTRNLLYNDEIYIDKDSYNAYEHNIKNLCKFMQIFKTDLSDIEIKKEESEDKYICQIYFVYKNGKRIARQYESSGIKKMMTLYYALCNIENGGVVFVDELDANIHDVILIKLVDYIRKYTKGQLIFTTHNLGPMEILQRDKCSIDFLSNDSKITSWVKIGNCSAASVYRKGLIKYSPFNIEAFSFLGVFGNGSDQ